MLFGNFIYFFSGIVFKEYFIFLFLNFVIGGLNFIVNCVMWMFCNFVVKKWFVLWIVIIVVNILSVFVKDWGFFSFKGRVSLGSVRLIKYLFDFLKYMVCWIYFSGFVFMEVLLVEIWVFLLDFFVFDEDV